MTDGLLILVITGSVGLVLALPSFVRRSRRRVAGSIPSAALPSDYSDLVGTGNGMRFEKRMTVVDDSIPYDNMGPPPSVG